MDENALDSDRHEFDDLRWTVPLKDIEARVVTDVPKNALTYKHYYQYLHGDFFRAVLGRDVVYDREWEQDLMSLMDEILSRPEHACQYLKFVGRNPINIRGYFWRWNDWTPQHFDWRPRSFPCSMRVNGWRSKYIFFRRIGDRVDLEGEIWIGPKKTKKGVLTINFRTWEKRYESLFKEVRLWGRNERSIYQNKKPVERIDDVFGKGFEDTSDELSLLSKTDRREGASASSESVSAVSSKSSERMVSKSWRVLESFRGTTLEEWRKIHPERLEFGSWLNNVRSS